VDNAFLERERDRRLLRELLVGLGGMLILGGGLLAYTWMHIETVRIGYTIDRLERQAHALLEEERRLRLEAAYRAHPQRIEERARRELGMRLPTQEQTLFYEELVP